jgi:hypothetical protein
MRATLADERRSELQLYWRFAMVRRQGRNWGLRATFFAAIIVWQIYEMATANVFTTGEGGYLNLLILSGALIGLVASLVKLTTEG